MKVKNSNIEMIYSLSPLQEGLLYHNLADSNTTDYVVQYVLKCEGTVDVDFVQKALDILAKRYDIFRTAISYKKMSKPRQVVLANRKIEFHYFDVSNEEISQINDILADDVKRGFDLQKDSLLRVTMLRISDSEYRLLWTFHHIIMDGWSVGIALNDFLLYYSQFAQGENEQKIEQEMRMAKAKGGEYKKYIEWIEQQDRSDIVGYWKNLLQDYDNSITIEPTVTPAKCDTNMRRRRKSLDKNVFEQIKKISSDEKVTLSNIAECIWGITLQKYNYCSDILFGEVVSGRDINLPMVESLVGLLINTIPIRVVSKEKESFFQLVKRHQESYADKSQYSICSLADIQSETGVGNDAIRTLFVYENYYVDYSAFNSIKNTFQVELETAREETNYDLTVSVNAQDDVLNLEIMYDPNRYSDEEIDHILLYMSNIYKQIADRPDIQVDDIEIISESDRNLIIEEFSGIKSSKKIEENVVELFEKCVDSHRDSIAIRCNNESYTYGTINEYANALAEELIKMGVKNNSPVAVIAERNVWTIISTIAIIKAGGGYVPIDPQYPLDRIRYIIEDCKPVVLIGEKPVDGVDVAFFDISKFEFTKGNKNPGVEINPDDLVYIIYTSGTTGNPKGSLICHRSIVRLVRDNNYLELDEQTVMLQTGSLSFDAATLEIWGALLNGGVLVLASKDVFTDCVKLKKVINEENINTMWMTSTLFNQMVLMDYHVFDTVEDLLIGGEKLSEYYVHYFKKNNHFTRLTNGYGPTENTTFTTTYEIKEDDEKLPIGKPITNTQVYIMNGKCLCGIGVSGELCTTGEGVSEGYLNLPDLTAERFVDNPFGTGKIYKTGDIVRWLPDGNIDYIGRVDDQVKIRGFRIELPEIECFIRSLDGVKDAVALIRTSTSGGKELIAYYVSEQITEAEVKEEMKKSMPSYMIPDFIVPVSEIPTTINGKLDKKKLLQIDIHKMEEYEDPINETEELLCKLYKEILGIDHVGRKDEFLKLGGHSLRVVRLINCIEKQLGVKLSIKDVFENSTVEQLAIRISECDSTRVILTKTEEKEFYPVAPQQQNIYYICEKQPDNIVYNIPNVFILHGEIDTDKMKQVFESIVERNEAFRTEFCEVKGEAVQKIHSESKIDYEYADIDHPLQKKEIEELVQPFDLKNPPLIRAKLMKLDDTTFYFFVDMHHIVADGASVLLFMNQLRTLYKGEQLDSEGFQYKDYTEWLKNVDLDAHKTYWKEQLSGEIPVLELPVDKMRPQLQQFEGANVFGKIDSDLLTDMKDLAKITHSTDFMILLSSVMILLSKYSRQDDIIVGIPSNGRYSEEMETIIGMFVNTLPIRENIGQEESFVKCLEKVKTRCLGAYNHEMYSFDKMVQLSDAPQDPSRNPIFSVMVAMQETGNIDNDETFKCETVEMDMGVAKFDLTFHIQKDSSGISYVIEYATCLFEKESIELLNHHFLFLLKSLLKNPYKKLGEISLCDEGEFAKIVDEFNNTDVMYRFNETVLKLFEESVEQNRDEIAIVDGNIEVTYGELEKLIDAFAWQLDEKGVEPGDFVALYMERSIEMLVAIYAVLKTGATYVPIDVEYPITRVNYILNDCSPKCILVTKHDIQTSLSKVEVSLDNSGSSQEKYISKATPELTAYMIYTSGTTGNPKGVLVGHNNLMNYISYALEHYFQDAKAVPLFTNYCFDLTVTTIFGTLCSGSKLIVYKGDGVDSVKSIFTNHEITTVKLTPSHLKIAATLQGNLNPNLKVLILGGEELDTLTSNMILERYGKEIKIHNEYGPTEATVGCCDYVFGEADRKRLSVSIGYPIWNTKILIMDQDTVCGVGIPGEICILGDGVAQEYYHLEELTAKKFVIEPNTKLKMYRTGDLGRFRSNGELEYYGRIDDQVKIRGFRIELGEINEALRSYEGVKDSVVIVRENDSKEKELYAYFVESSVVSLENLIEHLEAKLPAYMLPSYYCRLDELPYTFNGKIDKSRLPKNVERVSFQYVEPKTELEIQLCKFVEDIFAIERVGISDNLFRIGGNSLKVMRLVNRIEELGYRVSIRNVFDNLTVEKLIPTMTRVEVEEHLETAAEKEFYPLSPSQKMIYIASSLDKDGMQYNMPMCIEFQGEIDADKMKVAFKKLVDQTEILRTAFVLVEGSPMQKVYESVTCEFDYEENSHTDIENVSKGFVRPFALDKPNLIRIKLIKASTDLYYMLIDWHHIIGDGVSVNLLLQRLCALYQTGECEQTKWQYRDYSEWIVNRDFSADKVYWENLYNTIPENIVLPFAKKHSNAKDKAMTIRVDGELSKRINDYARRVNASEFMYLLSGVLIMLSKYTNQQDLVIGVPSSGRNILDVENLIGMFVNTLALRFDVNAECTCEEFIQYVKNTCMNAYEHQEYPFEHLMQYTNSKMEGSSQPLINIMFTSNSNEEKNNIEISDFVMKSVEIDMPQSKFDLTISVNWIDDAYEIMFEYGQSMFEKETMTYMMEHLCHVYERMLMDLTKDLKQLNLCTSDEKKLIETNFNKQDEYFDLDVSIVDLIQKNAVETPDKIALVYANEQLTYAQLEEKTNSCAFALQQRGVGVGDKVAIIPTKSLEITVLLYAILKLGAIYVPIDANYPEQRIRTIIDDCKPKLVVTFGDKSFEGISAIGINDLMIETNEVAVGCTKDNNRLAYIIYTSGTTGVPKGVMVTEKNILSLVYKSDYTDLNRDMVTAQTGSLAFDASTFEIWATLVHGGELHILNEDILLDVKKMKNYLANNKITTMFLTVALFNQYISSDVTVFDSLSHLMIGGEKVSEQHMAMLIDHNKTIDFRNIYGPTETTTFAVTYKVLKFEESIPIGMPITNTQTYIVQDGKLCGIGVPGELWIGGSGVSMGYLNLPDLTKERFVDNPFGKGTLYKTGDLCMWRYDGAIEYLKRSDDQVKIHGYRIELEDIENALRQIEEIRDAVVIVKESEAGEKQLVAYYVSDRTFEVQNLMNEIGSMLPEIMVPKIYMKIESIPLSVNGKVDKRSLPKPIIEKEIKVDFEAATDDIEKEISDIFIKVLKVNSVGVNNSFYEMGGSSIEIIRLISMIEEKYGVSLAVRDIMRAQTIRKISLIVKEALNRTSERNNGENSSKMDQASIEKARKVMHDSVLEHCVRREEQRSEYSVSSEYTMNPAQVFCYKMGAKTCKVISRIENDSHELPDENFANKTWNKALSKFPILKSWIDMSADSPRIYEYSQCNEMEIPLFDISQYSEQQQTEEIDCLASVIQGYLEESISMKPASATVALKTGQNEIVLVTLCAHTIFDGLSGQILQDYIEGSYMYDDSDEEVSDYSRYVDFCEKAISPKIQKNVEKTFKMKKIYSQLAKQVEAVDAQNIVLINHKIDDLKLDDIALLDLLKVTEKAWIDAMKTVFGLRKMYYFTVNSARKTQNYDFTSDAGMFLQYIPQINRQYTWLYQLINRKKMKCLYQNDLSTNHIIFGTENEVYRSVDLLHNPVPVLNNLVALGDIRNQITGFEENGLMKFKESCITNICRKDNAIYFEGLLGTVDSEEHIRAVLDKAFEHLKIGNAII